MTRAADTASKAPDNGSRALMLLAWASGMGSVVYEVLYVRQLTAVLGDMYYVHATLIAVFLFGIGLGALLAHRFTRWLFAFEGFIALWALVFPATLAVYTAIPLATLFIDPLAYTLLSVLMLLAPPAIAIGFSIPLFSHYIEATGAHDDAFGVVYYVYNFGATISILLVEFVVLRSLDHTSTLRLVALLNLGCAVFLWLRRAQVTPKEADVSVGGGQGWRRQLVAVLFVGLASALFHSFFLQVGYHLLLPFRENFALCTAAVLLGIALGTDLQRKRGWTFARAAASGALAVALMAALAPAWPLLYSGPEFDGTLLNAGYRFVVVMLLGGVPYVFLGATIPAILSDADHALASGQCLFVSGVGNAVGFLLYMFVVHPNIHVFGIVGLIVGLLAVGVFTFPRVHTTRRDVALLGVAGVLSLGTLTYEETLVYLCGHTNVVLEGASNEVLKSASDSVVVSTLPDTSVVINYNGHPGVRARTAEGIPNHSEVLSGMFSWLWAPSTERAMILGMGTGLTAGTAALLFEHTDVVEINYGFWKLARDLDEVNQGLTRNPKATLHHNDGRRFLMHTEHTYDVIVNSIPSPRYAAASKIYTVEFFEHVSKKLKPGGVYSTWFTAGDMSPAGGKTLLSSLHHVFPHCQLNMLRSHYYFLNCSKTPLTYRGERMDTLPASFLSLLSKALATPHPRAIIDVLQLSDDIFTSFEPVDVLNTDAYPRLEYQIMEHLSVYIEEMRDPLVANVSEWGVRVSFADDPQLAAAQRAALEKLHPTLYSTLVESTP